jgi:glycosyltransferase involved in cell wall biosynthesis
MKIPWVADLQDPWALDEMWLYPTGIHRRRDLRRMRTQLSSASAIVKNTPEATRRLRDAFPEFSEKARLSIPNGFEPSDFEAPAPRRDDAGKVFRIVHTGYLHTELGLDLKATMPLRRALGGVAIPVNILTRSHVYLLEALERMVESDPSLSSTVELHLAGMLSASDRHAIGESDFVKPHGYLEHRDAVELMRTADLLFLPMHDLPNGRRAGLVPGKTYEYLASGRPILAAVPAGDARDLLAQTPVANLCRPDDVDEMARIISAQIERWRAGIPPPTTSPELLRPFERRHLTAELAELFDRILTPRRHSARPGHAERSARLR